LQRSNSLYFCDHSSKKTYKFRCTGTETFLTLSSAVHAIACFYELLRAEFMDVKRTLSRNGYASNFCTVDFSNF